MVVSTFLRARGIYRPSDARVFSCSRTAGISKNVLVKRPRYERTLSALFAKLLLPLIRTLFNRTPYLRNSLPETCLFSTLISIPLERYETFVEADLTTREFIEYHDCSRRNKDETAKFLVRAGCHRMKIPSNSPLVQRIESGATIKPDINFHGPIPPTKFQLVRLKRLLQPSRDR